MPNTSSAKKRLRQNEVRRLRNRSVKSSLRTQMRKVRDSIKVGDLDKAAVELRLAQKKLDQAGAKRVIHPNKAARTKSRLVKMLRRAQAAAAQS